MSGSRSMVVLATGRKQSARPTLGSALKSIRLERGWSLADASRATGLSVSSISKIENGLRSLTFDKLLRLADSLNVEVARLFSETSGYTHANVHAGRRSIQKASDGFVIEAGVYTYTFLAEDLRQKRFHPALMQLHARSVDQFEQLIRHSGEEFIFVLEGEIEVHTEVYAPLRLVSGESVYFDSSVGHVFLDVGNVPARILNIASEHVPTPPRRTSIAQPPKPALAQPVEVRPKRQPPSRPRRD